MAEERIPPADRAIVIETLIRQAKMGRLEADAMRSQALETPPETAYDALNLLTATSTHIIRNPMQVVRAQRATTTHRRICPVCRRER